MRSRRGRRRHRARMRCCRDEGPQGRRRGRKMAYITFLRWHDCSLLDSCLLGSACYKARRAPSSFPFSLWRPLFPSFPSSLSRCCTRRSSGREIELFVGIGRSCIPLPDRFLHRLSIHRSIWRKASRSPTLPRHGGVAYIPAFNGPLFLLSPTGSPHFLAVAFFLLSLGNCLRFMCEYEGE